MHERINDSFREKFASAPINQDSFVNHILQSQDLEIFDHQIRMAIIDIVRRQQPKNYGEFLRIFRLPEISAISSDLARVKQFPFQDMILETTFKIYDYLRNKDESLPRNGYRPEEIEHMTEAEKEILENELERSSDMINQALISILGVHPGDL